MRLPWFTISDHRGYNTLQSVLWTDHGFYAWTNSDLGMICIDFYPKPPERREVTRIGSFLGPNRIDEAEKAVERDIANRSGKYRIIEGECVKTLVEAEQAAAE